MATNILQTADGDIYVAPDGTQRWTANLQEEVAQRLRSKYRLFRGEWFLDTRTGVPYWELFGEKPINYAAVRSVLRRVASTDPGVASVEHFETAFDGQTRHLTVTISVLLTDGTVLALEPFVV